MSKNYLGRCAAVGIAGLTAMSSVAIVASAASQASAVYELKYNGIENVGMIYTAGYATLTNQYCVGDAENAKMGKGFVVNLEELLAIEYSYKNAETNEPETGEDAWSDDSFKDVAFEEGGVWTYQEYGASFETEPAALKEVYADRTGDETTLSFLFKTEAERDAAKSAIKSKIQSEYNAMASKAVKQFNADIDAAKKVALAKIDETYAEEVGSADAKGKQTAANKRSAAKSAVNNSASKIKSEFRSTFTASNFRIDDDAFEENTYAIVFGSTFAGVTTGYKYDDGADGEELTGAKYYSVSSKYVNEKSYAFKGEIQLAEAYIAGNVNGLCISGNDWLNYEILNYNTNSGGNTTTDGKTDSSSKTDKTTTSTSWYPDSSTYRSPSEVSYLGENGSWYTSASAASVYGGGYTGTSKSSNYSSVNSSADGKAIYFNSSTGSYSTSSTSYSYVVKEATSSSNTSTSDDPYYSYFFNNGTTNKNNTTTVAAGSASIKGASKYAGWTNITSYITNKAKSGATYSINMNDETIVPSTVLAAAKAKNVTLTFINDNGSKVTVKPGKVSSDLDVSVIYNVKDIKTSLVNKAKKVNAGTVSTAQVRIGEDGSIGGTATVNVKFSTKRAGCKVKAYRLSESGSLVKNATGTINSSGRVNLNLTKGGSYLLVVIDD